MRIPRAFVVLLAFGFVTGCSDGTGPGEGQVDPVDPGPGPTIELAPPTMVGDSVFPVGDTSTGGQGQTVSGVSCIETIAYHDHAHLGLFVNGRQVAIPGGIGIVNPYRTPNGFMTGNGCHYWLHTHDASGLVHIEPPTQQTVLTLGQLFDIWGRPLTHDGAAGFSGPVTAFVDGTRYTGDVRDIPLVDDREITLQVGTRLAPIPSYIFPENY